MNENEIRKSVGLTSDSISLVVTQLFRLLFGGYLIGFDLYYYNDLESAFSVLLIYIIIGIFTTLFLCGKRKSGLLGLIALSVVLLILETIYTIVYFSQATPDPSLHDPLANWWASVLNFIFPILTLIFAIKVYKGKS
jgi:hypothetical protein